MSDNAVVYRMTRTGPSTEPCGTLKSRRGCRKSVVLNQDKEAYCVSRGHQCEWKALLITAHKKDIYNWCEHRAEDTEQAPCFVGVVAAMLRSLA